jgi:hypothetical protein
MGAKVSNFVQDVAKAGLKGATSYVLGTYIPYVGSHLAGYLNSKYQTGGVLDMGSPPDLPEGFKPKEISTPAQLKSLVQKFPEQASKYGLTVEKINEEVKEAKAVSKAVGGMLNSKYFMKSDIQERPKLEAPKEPKIKMAKGGEPEPARGSPADVKKVKVKKPRSQAQLDATKRLVEANRKRREKK